MLQNLGAAGAGIIAALFVGIILGSLLISISEILIFVTFIASLVTLFYVAIVLSAKRHVNIYRDDRRAEQLLEIQQESKWQFPMLIIKLRMLGE